MESPWKHKWHATSIDGSKRKYLLFALGFLSFCLAVEVLHADDAESPVQRREPTGVEKGQAWRICRIVRRENHGSRQLGTGFIVIYGDRSWLVTTSHVIAQYLDDLDSIYYSPNGRRSSFPAKLVKHDRSCDLAIFSIKTAHTNNDTLAELPKLRDHVFTIGYTDKTVASGLARVARGKVVWLTHAVVREGELFLTDERQPRTAFFADGLDPHPGASGSPVFSTEGTIIGYMKGHDQNGDAVCFSGKGLRDALQTLVADSSSAHTEK